MVIPATSYRWNIKHCMAILNKPRHSSCRGGNIVCIVILKSVLSARHVSRFRNCSGHKTLYFDQLIH
ncbi:uncharacterized protein ARMOST_00148 [Armillaria ostoyae]|uniref:Uncharacterized protein n=1 Tax=Armillaria ostoyae TaxID=47428 RepID=A0A284QKC8_ARMOS|nr:uncharacterized protein ARMOST_00148 [Armillaria ostoyae]